MILVRESSTPELMGAAMRAGARDVVTLATTPAVGARRRSAPTSSTSRCAAPPAALHLSKVISVFSPKGGVGKTTVAVNLALALTDRGARRVCLVDLDLAFGDVVDHHAALPQPLHRARHRLRDHASTSRCSTACSPATRTP